MKKSIFTSTIFMIAMFLASASSLKAQYYYQQPKQDNTAEVVGAILGVIAAVVIADEVDKGNITTQEVKKFGKDLNTVASAFQSISEERKITAQKPQPAPANPATEQIKRNNADLRAQILVRQFEIQQSINYYDALGRKWKADSFRQ